MVNKKIFSKVRNCPDYETYQEVQEEVSLRFELNHPNILNLIDFSSEQIVQSPYNTQIQVSNYYEYPENNLEQILKMNHSRQNKLTQQDLIELGIGMLKALDHLFKFELFHGDLRPQYIGINDVGQFILLDRLNESSSLELQKMHIQNQQQIYMSQELLNYLKSGGNNEEEFNSLQSELFSLGIILLECGLDQNINDCYDYEQLQIDQKRLQNYVIQFKQKYQDSQILQILIEEFLSSDSNTDISEVLQKIQNFRRGENINKEQPKQNYQSKQPLFQNHYQPTLQNIPQNNINNQVQNIRLEKPSFNPKNPKRKSRILKNHYKKQTYNHPYLGEITLLENQNNNNKIFSQTQPCYDFEELSDKLEQLRGRFEANHPNILKILDYSTQDLPNNPQKQKFLVTSYFEYPKKFLKEMIDKNQLRESQVEQLISNILNAFVKLYEMEVFHKDIRADYIAQNDKGNFILIDLQDQRTSAEIQRDRIDQKDSIYISEEFFKFILEKRTDEDSIDNFRSELFGFGLILIEITLGVNIQQIYDYQQKKIERDTLQYFQNQFKSKFYQNEAIRYIIDIILNQNFDSDDYKKIVQNYKNLLKKNKQQKFGFNKKQSIKVKGTQNKQIPKKPQRLISQAQLFRKSPLEDDLKRTSDQDHQTLGDIILCKSKDSNYEDIFEKEYLCKDIEDLEQKVQQILRRLSLNHFYILKLVDYSVKELQQNSLQNKFKVSAFYKQPNNILEEILNFPKNRPYQFTEEQLEQMCLQILKGLQHLVLHNKIHKNLQPIYIAKNDKDNFILIDIIDDDRSFEEIQRENLRNQEQLYLNEDTLQNICADNKCSQQLQESNQLFSLGLILLRCFVDSDLEELYDLEHLKVDQKLLQEYKEEFMNKCATEGILKFMINILIPQKPEDSKTIQQAIFSIEQFKAKQIERKKLGIQFKKAVINLLQKNNLKQNLDYNQVNHQNDQGMIKQQQVFSLKSSQQPKVVQQSQTNIQYSQQEPLFGYNSFQNHQRVQVSNKNNLPLRTYITRESQKKYVSSRVRTNKQEQPITRKIYVRADRSNSIIKRMNEEEKNAQNGRSQILQSSLQNSNFDQKYKDAQLVQRDGNIQVYRLNNSQQQKNISHNIQKSFIEHRDNPNKRISRIVRVSNNKPIRSKSNIRNSTIKYSKYQEYRTSPITVSVERRVTKSSLKRFN